MAYKFSSLYRHRSTYLYYQLIHAQDMQEGSKLGNVKCAYEIYYNFHQKIVLSSYLYIHGRIT